jgi:hypothetical protein
MSGSTRGGEARSGRGRGATAVGLALSRAGVARGWAATSGWAGRAAPWRYVVAATTLVPPVLAWTSAPAPRYALEWRRRGRRVWRRTGAALVLGVAWAAGIAVRRRPVPYLYDASMLVIVVLGVGPAAMSC